MSVNGAEKEKVRAIFDSIAGRYDFANLVLSGSVHLYWQKRLFRLIDRERAARKQEVPQKCERALDVCTGSGALLPPLAERLQHVIGVDFSEQMLLLARTRVEEQKLHNTRLLLADALDLPLENGFADLITVAYGVRNFSDTRAGLKELCRVLKPGGKLFVLEFGQPRGKIFGFIYRQYARLVLPLLGGLITGNRQAYAYLKNTSAAFPCREEFSALLMEAGFEAPYYESLTGGIAYLYCASKSRDREGAATPCR